MVRKGFGTIPASKKYHYVIDTLVSSTSLVSVSLTSDPNAAAGGCIIKEIIKNPGYGFMIYLTNPCQRATTFDYKLL